MNQYIDLCSCFDPIFYPPKEVLNEWKQFYELDVQRCPEPYYGTELDGTTHFYIGNTRIKVSEHFNDRGKAIGSLIEDVILFSHNLPL